MAGIFVVTDDCVLERGLSQILDATEDLRLAGSCFDMDRAAEVAGRLHPDIILIDMTASTSLSIVSDIRKASPASRICLWARHLPSEMAYHAMTMGIRGILRRPLPVADVLRCLRTISRDEVWFEEQLMAGFFSRPVVRLTRRESQLVNLLAQGLRNKEIAYALSLSEGTVKVYLSRLFEKLHVKDRLELALYGIRNLTADRVADAADAHPVAVSCGLPGRNAGAGHAGAVLP